MAYGDRMTTGVWRGGRRGVQRPASRPGPGAARFRARFRRRPQQASDRAKEATLRRQPPQGRGQQTGARGAYGATEQAGAIDKARAGDVGSAAQRRLRRRGRGRGRGAGGRQATTGTEYGGGRGRENVARTRPTDQATTGGNVQKPKPEGTAGGNIKKRIAERRGGRGEAFTNRGT